MNISTVDRAYAELVMDELGKVIENLRPKTAPQQVAIAVALSDLCGAAIGAILAMGEHLCGRDNDVPASEKGAMMEEVQRELMSLAAKRIVVSAGAAVDICGEEIRRQIVARGNKP